MLSPACTRFQALSSSVTPTQQLPLDTAARMSPELSSSRPSNWRANCRRVSSRSPPTAWSRVTRPVKQEPDTPGSVKAILP